MVVGELARGLGKGQGRGNRRRKHSLRGLLLLIPLSLCSSLAMAAPTGGQVTAGTGTITQSGSTTTINQSSQNLSLSWKAFNVASSETVNFNQPNASSLAINRIADTQGSTILGHINANGQVWLINPNGILFGSSAQVNVGGLVASTLDTADGSTFSGTGTGSVVNEGSITASQYVALLGHSVTNRGVITARLGTVGGTVAMGAGDNVSLTFSGNQLVKLQVNQSVVNALVANHGLIKADGGMVIMNAGARDTLLASVVNNDGIVQAQTVSNHKGTITLLGGMAAGTVNVGGTLDASAPNGGDGGSIETSAHTVKVADGTAITTKAASGLSGNWLIDPADFTISSTASGTITGGTPSGDVSGSTLSTALGSGNVTILSSQGSSGTSGNINVDDTVSWSANTLTLKAQNNININSAMNATGTAGLALDYGQASASGGSSTYNVNAPVNLAATSSFTTQKGTNSANAITWTIVDSLGSSNTSTTKTDLQGINGDLTGHYVLGANIDAKATSTNTTAWGTNGFTPIGNATTGFTGSLDGLGHTISNLYIKRTGSNDIGLFGVIGAAGAVHNVGLMGGGVSGGQDVGELAGANSGSITNVYATGTVSGSTNTGALVGINQGGATIFEAYATGTVSGTTNVGGLVGNNAGTISNAYATGHAVGWSKVGGLVGYNSGSIDTAYVMGYGTGHYGNPVGTVIGSNVGNALDVYSTDLFPVGAGNSNGISWITPGSGWFTSLLNGFSPAIWGNAGNQSSPYLLSNAAFTTVSGQVWARADLGATYYDVIATATQLQNINSTGLGNRYLLGNSIDAAASAGWNGGAGFVPIGNLSQGFTGTFDGDGYTLSGLSINRPGTNTVGLFGFVSGGTLRNLKMAGASIRAGSAVGALVGLTSNATISNVYTTNSSVSGSTDVGGLVGYNASGSIGTVTVTGSVSATGSDVGGLVGYNANDTISSAYATGSVSGGSDVGGLVGYNAAANISGAVAIVNVSGSTHVGGLVGSNNTSGSISDAYAIGNVSGSTSVGGLVGSNNSSGTISSAYAIGNVSGSTNVGGLAGKSSYGTISNAYATGAVTGSTHVGGLVGTNNHSGIGSAYATGHVSGGAYAGGLVGYNANTSSIANAYWDSTTAGTAQGIGGGTNTGAATAMTSGALAAALPAGFSSGTWARIDNKTTPYLSFAAGTADISGRVIFSGDNGTSPTYYDVVSLAVQ